MSFLNGLHGSVAALLISALLFVDEMGVPMPFAPNEALLLVAGLLIAGGALPPFLFLPVAVVAMTAGMIAGFGWARAVGSDRLRGIAARFGAEHTYDRAATRVRSSSPTRIFLTRLIPGVRTYATLVAGAAEMDVRVFLVGAVPAIVVWAGLFTALGMLVGVPAEHLLSRFERLGATGGLMILLAAGTWVVVRRAPSAGAERLAAVTEVPGRLRLGLALLVDVGIVVVLVAGADRVLRAVVHRFEPNSPGELLILGGAVVLAYVLISRGGAGATAGESLFDVTYRGPTRSQSPAPLADLSPSPTAEPPGPAASPPGRDPGRR